MTLLYGLNGQFQVFLDMMFIFLIYVMHGVHWEMDTCD